MKMLEVLWLAILGLSMINVCLWLAFGWALRRLGRLEDICQALTDPDEYTNMLANLEIEKKRRDQEWRDRHDLPDVAGELGRFLKGQEPYRG